MSRIRIFLYSAGTVCSAVLAGCADSSQSASSGTVPATFGLSQGSVSALSSVASNVAFDVAGGPVALASIDSLIVTVTRVDVLPDSELQRCHPPEGDSLEGFHPGRPGPGGPCGGPGGGDPFGPAGPGRPDPRFGPGGPFGPDGHGRDSLPERPDHPHTPDDSIMPPGNGWGSHARDWFSLDIVGSGHVDLLHLPVDSASGLTLAAGAVPAGSYGAARLIVSSANIYFNTPITNGTVTLAANTAYPVLLPHRPGGPMGIMTNAGFTVPTGGGSVILIFDKAATIGGAAVTDSGQVVIRPMLRPHRPH